MPKTRILGLLVLGLLLPARILLGQSVRWEPPGGTLGLNQISELSLVFDNCEPSDGATLPSVDGLVFGRPSQSSQTSIVNFKVSRRFSLLYPVRPTKRGALRIPSFTVETSAGRLTVPEAAFTVDDVSVAGTGQVSLDDIASVQLDTPKRALWVGEVFPLTYTLSVVRNRYYALDPALQWSPAPFVAEEWSKPNPAETVVRGERRVVSTQTTRALAREPGNFSLGPVTQVVQLIVGTSGLSLFAQPVVEPRQLLTAPLDLTVKPLPPPPADFRGAVGQFTFTSKIVPTATAVNEPITWTLELAGTGNWPDVAGLPPREVSNDFSVVQPKSKRTMKDGSLFEGTLTEDVVLVPTRPGTYTLGPVRFTYFDPKAGSYRTLTTEAVTVTVGATGTPAAAPGGVPQFALPPLGGPELAPTAPTAVAPVPPGRLPRDPLPTGTDGLAPWSTATLAWIGGLAATLVPLLAWLTLAALRAHATDRARRRREARRELTRLLSRLRAALPAASAPAAAPSPAVADLLREWQREAAALWEIAHAAPGTTLLHHGVATRARDSAGAWARLWQEADRTLHGPPTPLPSDWVLRAEGALQAVRIPAWSPLTLFARRNLFPFTAALVLLAALAQPAPARAETGTTAYTRADFPGAEAAWRSTLAQAPHDWAAHHNLGLALAQQDRWSEAAAHWSSAFLLHPRSPHARWALSLGLQQSGLAPPELVAFSRGEGRHGLARAASPGEWQLLLVGAACLLAAALCALLLHGYRRLGPWARPAGLTACLAAVLLAGTATFSLHTYGVLAHPAAAFVWRASVLHSIPTDADTTQKTTPLSAGSIAVVDRTFLGWSRLAFPGGQSGWVRSEDLLPLYR